MLAVMLPPNASERRPKSLRVTRKSNVRIA
jgi:hypothetical protein